MTARVAFAALAVLAAVAVVGRELVADITHALFCRRRDDPLMSISNVLLQLKLGWESSSAVGLNANGRSDSFMSSSHVFCQVSLCVKAPADPIGVFRAVGTLKAGDRFLVHGRV